MSIQAKEVLVYKFAFLSPFTSLHSKPNIILEVAYQILIRDFIYNAPMI